MYLQRNALGMALRFILDRDRKNNEKCVDLIV
jgi:hypothetical protein